MHLALRVFFHKPVRYVHVLAVGTDWTWGTCNYNFFFVIYIFTMRKMILNGLLLK
jgi:hypothetical protein